MAATESEYRDYLDEALNRSLDEILQEPDQLHLELRANQKRLEELALANADLFVRTASSVQAVSQCVRILGPALYLCGFIAVLFLRVPSHRGSWTISRHFVPTFRACSSLASVCCYSC